MALEVLSREPDHVVFGAGAEAETARLLEAAGARRVLLVARARYTAGAERIAAALGERSIGLFVVEGAQVPGEVADDAVACARATGADWVLAHGGGTPIGVAKAIALALPVSIAAVPTTYAGSERTNVWGITRGGRKLTGRDDRVRPRLVVYDPDLTLDLDRAISLDSLMNAIAHAVEALYAADATAAARTSAEEALTDLVEGARAIALDPRDRDGRARALRGAALASVALGGASMGPHHKLAHVLGGSFGTAHARTHAVLLPYTLGFVAPAVPETVRVLERAWGSADPAAFLYDLQRSLGLATSLRSLPEVSPERLPEIADQVLETRYPSPRVLDHEALLSLLDDALHDRRPSLFTRRFAMPARATGMHAGMPVTERGAPLASARAVIVALHGRGASADRFAADLERRLGPRADVCVLAPQAHGNAWYPKGFLAPLEENEPALGSALSAVEALFAHGLEHAGRERLLVVGFSQGACLALTWLSRTDQRPAHVLAFTGAPTPMPDARFAAARGATIHVGGAEEDPWVKREALEGCAATLRAAGADVSLALVPGTTHGIHPPDDEALSRAIERVCAS